MEIKTGFDQRDFASMNQELFGSNLTSKMEYVVVSTLEVEPGGRALELIAENDFYQSITSAKQPLKMAFVVADSTISQGVDSYILESAALGNHWEMQRFEAMDEAMFWVGES